MVSLCTQKYTSLVDVSDLHSFVECGATSIDAVLMTEDIRQAFSINYTPAADVSTDADDEDADKLPLLLDKILHCLLSDVVQYISSQLCGFQDATSDAAAAAANSDKNDDVDDKDLSAPLTSSKDVPARALREIAACIQTDAVSRTGQSSNMDDHSQPLRDTEPTWYGVNSRPESIRILASEPPVKRPRTTTSNDVTSADAELSSTVPGLCQTLLIIFSENFCATKIL